MLKPCFMKYFIKLMLFAMILHSFQCTSDKTATGNITQIQLTTKKTEIDNYINSFPCSESIGCGFIAFGSKPCGGPRTFLVFPNSVNLTLLQEMVNNYNEMDKLRNIQTNAVSDCSVSLPPNEVKCINGVCTIIN